MQKIIKVYVSHSIRGKFGKNATSEQMTENCEKAKRFGEWLKSHFPEIEWYIPAEHDDFIRIAYLKGYVTDKQILDVDCDILKEHNGLLVYAPDDYISEGMKIEIDFADEHKIPIFYEVSSIVYSENRLPTCSGKKQLIHFIEELQNG